jgi:predicted regulator of Ras-like GTPase activity (Roadblock/LC7/MglB family)
MSVDGFALTSQLPGKVEERRASAVAAVMLALGEQTANELERGRLQTVFVEAADGSTIVTVAGPEAVPAAIAGKDAKLGVIFLQMGYTVESVKQTIRG